MRRVLPWIPIVCVLTALLPQASLANIPLPELSDVPAMIPITSDGSLEYMVRVMGQLGPVNGALVEIEFSPEAEALIAWCDGQDHPLLMGVADFAGEVTFNIAGGGCIDPGRYEGLTYIAQVRADGIVLGEPGVNSPDAVNGDGLLPTESGTCNCEGTVTQAGGVGAGLSDVHFHTTPIVLGLPEPCTKLTPPFDGPVNLADVVTITPYLRGEGGKCDCTACLPPPFQTQPNAKIALHVKGLPAKGLTVCTDTPNDGHIPCTSYATDWPGFTGGYVYLVVAKADVNKGIGALSCGVEYGSRLDANMSWVLCADMEFSGTSWPDSGTGNRLAWIQNNCRNQVIGSDGVHAVAGAFYAYSYGDEQIRISRNPEVLPDPELAVTDCRGRVTPLPITSAGSVSFGFAPQGCNPCLGPCNLPEFLSITRTPCPVEFFDTPLVTVFATNSDSAKLTFAVNTGGPETTVAMTMAANVANLQQYTTTLPAQTAESMVRYWVELTNNNPDTTVSDTQGYSSSTVLIDSLRVNDSQGRNLYTGCYVRAVGVVTADFSSASITRDYYIRDATGGINLFRTGTLPTQPVLGDTVSAIGEVAQIDGNLVLTDGSNCGPLQVSTDASGPAPAPILIKCYELDEEEEGLLFNTKGLLDTSLVGTTFEADSTYTLLVSGCEDLVLRIDPETDIPGMTISRRILHIRGIFAQSDPSLPWDSGYLIQPRSQSDITFLDDPTGVEEPLLPAVARLFQNFPNPFSRSTQIPFHVPVSSEAKTRVRFSLFDVQGRLVKVLLDEDMEPGEKVVSLTQGDFLDARTGIYFYRLEVGNQVMSRKLMLVH